MGISNETFKNLLQIFWGWKLKMKKNHPKIGLKNMINVYCNHDGIAKLNFNYNYNFN